MQKKSTKDNILKRTHLKRMKITTVIKLTVEMK